MPLKSIPEIYVEGNNYKIGYKIGQKFKKEIEQTISNVNFSKIFPKDIIYSKWIKKIKEIIENEMPEYINELMGLADGIGYDYENILLYNCLHALDFEMCSTVMIKKKKEIVLGHNEDYSLKFGENSYLIHAKLPNNSQFFSFAYPGTLPGSAFGINSNGLIFSANSLPSNPLNYAFPRFFVDRKILELENIEDIKRLFIAYSPRSAPLNYNILSYREKRAINIETTWNDIAIHEIKQRFFHTNHFISDKFKKESNPQFQQSSSFRRLKVAKHYFKTKDKQQVYVKDLLFHPKIHGSVGENQTLCTAVFRVKDKNIEMQIYGNSSKDPIIIKQFPDFWVK